MITIEIDSNGKGVYTLDVYCPFNAQAFIQRVLAKDENVNKDGYQFLGGAWHPAEMPRTRLHIELKGRCILADAQDVAKKIQNAFKVQIEDLMLSPEEQV